MEDVTNPEVFDSVDTGVEGEQTPETSGNEAEGTKDVQGNGYVENLSLDDLNTIAGRKFDSKDDFFKHYKNLSSFVGKKQEVKAEEVPELVGTLQEKIAKMERESEVKDFLLEHPTAKDDFDLIEAYAEKQGISLSEAFESKFANRTKSSPNVINKNRSTPVQSQQKADLIKRAQAGDESAQDELVLSIYN